MFLTTRAMMLLALKAAEEGRVYLGYDPARGVVVGEMVRWIEERGGEWRSGLLGNGYDVASRLTADGVAERVREIQRRGRSSFGYRLTAAGREEVEAIRSATGALLNVDIATAAPVTPLLGRPVDLDPATSRPDVWTPLEQLVATAHAANWRDSGGWWFDADAVAVVVKLADDWHFRAGPGVLLPVPDQVDAPPATDIALWAALVCAGLTPFHHSPMETL